MSITPRRRLGDGRWDRKLKEKMVELSAADNYDDAKLEWTATGEVWWDAVGECPTWAEGHPYKCLCTHDIVYHFEIHNTETDVRECVGSDHINSYLILRAIKEETGLQDDQITDEMIEEWIEVRVEALKKNAWWKMYGDEFTKMFNASKDLDLRVNVRTKGRYYDSVYRMYRDVTFIRKSSSGAFGTPHYSMASIVWRWNHPDNPKAQQRTKGWPNQKLYNDLLMFYFTIGEAETIVGNQDKYLAKRSEHLANLDKKLEEQRKAEIERKQKVVATITDIQHKPAFEEACEYYGLEPFVPEQGKDSWEERFLADIKHRMIKGNTLTEAQAKKLWDILKGDSSADAATQKQKDYLIRLGYEGDVDEITKHRASEEIKKLKDSGKWL